MYFSNEMYLLNCSSSIDVYSSRSECSIMSRKQLEKITDNQLIEFAIKLQIKMITKVTELINDSNMEFQEKLRFINSKFDKLCRRLRKINRFIHFTDIHVATSKA